MALQTLNTIKQWFRTGLKPTQTQFWDTWDSFRHKFEKIPVKDIDGIDELLLSKADKTVLDNHLADKSAHAPQVNTDWNSESGFSQLLNKPEFRTVNGETIVGTGDIAITTEPADLQSVLDNGSYAKLENKTVQIYNHGANPLDYSQSTSHPNFIQITNMKDHNSGRFEVGRGFANIVQSTADGNTTTVEFENNFSETGNKVNIKFPSKPTGDYTLSTTSDFKTINGESIIGEGNLDIEPQGLKSVLDADPTASYGESKATLMGNYGTSKYNEIIVSDETEKTGIYQLKNQLSFDHTVLDSNDIGNITLSEGNVILTRDKSNNQTVVDISDPVANTQLRFPAKSEEGKTYTIATTDDFKTINGESIVGSGDIVVSGGNGDIPTLQEVLDKDRNATNASINLLSEGGESQTTVHDGGLNISEKTETGFLITDINKLGVSVSKDEETTFVNVLADELSLNKKLSGNPVKQGIVLNENSSGASTIKLPLTSDRDVKTLATKEDFKTINGESIVGEGDITIEGGASQNLQQTLANGNTTNLKSIFSKGNYVTTVDPSFITIQHPEQGYLTINPYSIHLQSPTSTGSAYLSGINGLSIGNESSASYLQYNPLSNQNGIYLFPLNKGFDPPRTLATTEDFKTINGESIVGTGDIAIEGGATSDATSAVKGIVKLTGDLGGTADTPTTPTAVHKTGDELIYGRKTFISDNLNKSASAFVTRDNATESALTANSTSTTLPAFTALATADNAVGISVRNFGTNSTGIRIEGNQNNPSVSRLLTLSNKKASNGQVDIATPLTILRDGETVATISNLGGFTGNSFTKTGGLASQFLKADGSVDSNVYNNDANVIHKTGDESKSGFLTLNTGLKLDSSFISWLGSPSKPTGSGSATITAIGNDIAIASGSSSRQFATFKTDLLSTAQTYSFPNNSGVIALLSDIPTNAPAGTSGSYTATVSEITNVSINGIGRMSNYIKVGNVVSVQANVNLNITASSTLSRFRISLPINIAGSATNFYCGQGTVFTTTAGTAAYPCQVYLNGGTEAIVQFNSEIGTGPRDVSFNFQYDITKSN
ncbi:hypothetical protein NJT12_12390 [Flavobacterium sp. AC]|uniref:Uncharacterized protein n=1 Tax=Flavobacterium azizsancarii TaxID=2961580 RepID=A0ABT4WE60_9FLAO|nr:hypothetical protein [Flavobacterium azizsancarii]MDA6070420.1 hypothetical protein [Flavobacterium azizsancarii]